MTTKGKGEMWRKLAKAIQSQFHINGHYLHFGRFGLGLPFPSKESAQAFKDNAIAFCEEKAKECEK